MLLVFFSCSSNLSALIYIKVVAWINKKSTRNQEPSFLR